MGTEKKQLTLFGDEVKIQAKKTKAEKFEDYDSFVQKFNRPELPKTTDECYTPQPVYDAVLSWLREKVDITDRPIVRPFYPGGDYRNYVYPENCVVVDNPPFSIVAEILRFYLATGIDYFLFGPGLTLFGNSPCGDCSVVCGGSLRYANNAVVATGFHTSLFPGIKVYIASTLSDLLRRVQEKAKAAPRIVYPKNVITSALLTKYAKYGKDCVVYENEVQVHKKLDLFNQLFGGGVFNKRRGSEAN